MKHFLILLFSIIVSTFISAQSISPSQDNEYCPNTEYIFSVALPVAYQSINTLGGCIIINVDDL